MGNRFPNQTCVLCDAPSFGKGEHVYPDWLVADQQQEGPFSVFLSGEPIPRRNGAPAISKSWPNAHVPMCKECNERLNASIECPAKPVFRRVTGTSASEGNIWLSAFDCAALTRLFLKIGLLSHHPAANQDMPALGVEMSNRSIEIETEKWLDWMRNSVDPPPEFSVYLSREDDGSDSRISCEKQCIWLPDVFVVGRSLHFQAWSYTLLGLSIRIVWHPGWPIENSQVLTGKAIELWPHPQPTDFGLLPVLDREEIGFALSHTVVSYASEETYTTAKMQPLRVGG
jgi:hypothetical protein